MQAVLRFVSYFSVYFIFMYFHVCMLLHLYVSCVYLTLFHFFYDLYFVWFTGRLLLLFLMASHVCIFCFIETDTRNVICTLYLWCPLDKKHKCLLGVLFMFFFFFIFSYFHLILLYIYMHVNFKRKKLRTIKVQILIKVEASILI